MHDRHRLKNPVKEASLFNQRTVITVLIVLLLFSFILLKLLNLQVQKHTEYQTLSDKNQLNLIAIPPSRGLIFDRNGLLLAGNTPIFTLELIPDKVKNLQKTLSELQTIITSIDEEDLAAFERSIKQHRRFEPVPLKFKLTPDEVAKFSVNQYRFPGVNVNAGLMRFYPKGALTAHLLGYVGRINAKELNRIDQAQYASTNFIGKVGIEKYYESQLHGDVGYQQVEIDASGRTVRSLKREPSQTGAKLTLTIDSSLQETAEKALKGYRGSVVAIDPRNGEILALVSTPSYDPNAFVKGISRKAYSELATSTLQPLYNRALRGQYPLASTIKPFIALSALDKKIIRSNLRIFDRGWFKLPNVNHLYRDWKRQGHGWVDLRRAIIISCDTYFYELANLMGIREIDEILNEFGFGMLTGIDMGEELPGLIPTPEWKKEVKKTPWYTGDTLISGIGQGFMLTTPLQLASATARLSMHGKHYKPHLLKEMVENNTVKVVKPHENFPLQLKSESSWREIISAMESVITDNHGTGFRFGRKQPYRVAAKTGTAQVYSIKQNRTAKEDETVIPERLRDHSLFIGFAPVGDPKLAIAVVVENAPIAGNVARKVFDNYLLKKKS